MSDLSDRMRPGVECAPWAVEEVKRIERECAELRRERDDFNMAYRMKCDEETKALDETIQQLERDVAELSHVLERHGFVRCDIPACACHSWHPRFGLPERMDEIKDALSDAGHPLSNENGNLPLNALRQLVEERDALRVEKQQLERENAAFQLRLQDLMMENAELRLDAERYRWLRDKGFYGASVDLGTDWHGDNFTDFKCRWRIPEGSVPYVDDDGHEWRAKEIDDAIDAAMKEKA